MSTKRVTISHDPFARESVVRETVTKHETQRECAWCGQPARFRYGTERDDSTRRASVNPKTFCSRSCARSYHS